MADVDAVRWQWWMAPARLMGRLRPGVLAAAASDAGVVARLPRVTGALLIPLAVIGLAAGFAALHAFSPGVERAFPLNWLRLNMEDIFTEVPLFLVAAIVIGALSPAAAVLFVFSFGAFDVVAATVDPHELHMSAVRPLPIVGRLVAYWLLWILAVEVPVFSRLLALSGRGMAASRPGVAALSGLVAGGFTLMWCHGSAVLFRPVYLWSDIGGPFAQGFAFLQNAPLVFALVAAVSGALVALIRGPGQLLRSVARAPRDATEQPRGLPGALASGATQLVVAGLLTVGLGGVITRPIDAVVVFAALAGARPLARLVARRTPIGGITHRLPAVLRLAAAVLLVSGVSFALILAPALHAVSEFFSIIVVFALGLFVIELMTATPGPRSTPQLSMAGRAGVAALVAVGLIGLRALAPAPAFADNTLSLPDLWAAFDAAVLGGLGTPVLVWLAKRPHVEITFGEPQQVSDEPGVEITFGTPTRITPVPPPAPKKPPSKAPGKRRPKLIFKIGPARRMPPGDAP